MVALRTASTVRVCDPYRTPARCVPRSGVLRDDLDLETWPMSLLLWVATGVRVTAAFERREYFGSEATLAVLVFSFVTWRLLALLRQWFLQRCEAHAIDDSS
jgi:hypothetical protein